MTTIALIPSNQHLNPYAGLPGVTEERWAVATCPWVKRRLEDRGAEVRIFHIPGKGEKSTDELKTMLDQAVAWEADYWLSVHSDACGDSAVTGVLMLMPLESVRSEGRNLGQMIGQRIGLPYKGSWVYGVEARTIMYLGYLRQYGIPGALAEIGEHATAAEAAWNWRHLKEIGTGIGDALADYLGLPATEEEEHDMTPEEVRTIAREEMRAATEVVHRPDEVAAAQQTLIDAGLLARGRPTGQAASIGYVDLLLSRVFRALKDKSTI